MINERFFRKKSSKRESELEKASTSSKGKNHNETYLIDKKKESKNHTLNQCLEEILFKKNKFQLSNAYDEKNSEEFLNNKNHYLEEVILSDKIHKNGFEKAHYDSLKSSPSSNNKVRYKIIITNYDEEKEKMEEKRSVSSVNIKKNKKNKLSSKFNRQNI